jgi:hypothetical protein
MINGPAIYEKRGVITYSTSPSFSSSNPNGMGDNFLELMNDLADRDVEFKYGVDISTSK